MINLCVDVFNELDLPINSDKCSCIRIGPRFNKKCSLLHVQQNLIPWTDSMKFLGIIILQSSVFKCSWSEAKNKFFVSCNTILGRLGPSAPLSTLIKLVNSHGLQNLLYGTSPVSLNQSELNNLDFTYNSFFPKFLTPNNKARYEIVFISVVISLFL